MKSLHKYTVHTIAIAKDKSQPAVFDDEPIILFFVFVVNKLQIKVHQNLGQARSSQHKLMSSCEKVASMSDFILHLIRR